MMMNTKAQTPHQILISEKRKVQEQSLQQINKLDEDVAYIKHHAGGLMLSGISAVLFPKTKTSSKEKSHISHPVESKHNSSATSMGFSDYMSILKEMTPVLWDVAKPLLVSWGLRKVRNKVVKMLRGK